MYTPSLLEKLVGDPLEDQQRSVLPLFDARQLRRSVARDLQDLLNTHATLSPADLEDLPLTRESLVTLGLVDISALSVTSDTDRRRISESIAAALAAHDRRLVDVKVELARREAVAATPGKRGLAFSITAKLAYEPGADPLVFDAVLHPGGQQYSVVASAGHATAREGHDR